MIDNANQKWMVAPRGVGIYVLNDNNSIDNKNDDQIKYLRTGLGYGNLPNNDVNCIVKDLNGKYGWEQAMALASLIVLKA